MTNQVMYPLVTIAIPAFKPTYLKEAINSALSQDYSNIELIIVNDKSPYDLFSIVQLFQDSRIRYYENKKNLGRENIVKNWNRCVEYAKGDFFVLLCDDDILEPNFVSELLKLAFKYPSCDVFHACRFLLDSETNKKTIDRIWPEWESQRSFYFNKLKWERLHTITEFLYRIDAIKQHPYIEFPMAWGSDDISILNIIKDGGVASSQVPLATFRINDEQISTLNAHIVEKAKARILNFYWCGEMFVGNPHDPHYMAILSNMLVDFVRTASIIDKFRIVIMVPNSIWNIHRKIKEVFAILLRRRRHPGYRCLGV